MGNLPQGAGLAFGGGLLYEREAAQTDGWGGGGGGGSPLNLWPQQWGSYVTHPEAQGRYHGASGL